MPKREHKNNKNADALINVHRNSFKHDFDWQLSYYLDYYLN